MILIFSLGWEPVHKNCTPIEGYTYKSFEDGFTSVVDGVYSIYHGGGYSVEIDLNLDSAKKKLSNLEQWKWVDRFTRFVVLESTVFNVNSRLFSRMKQYFEVSKAGAVLSNQLTDSMRLYPYVEIGDYITLAAQLGFILYTVARLIMFVHSMTKCSFSARAVFNILVDLTRLLLALGYVVFYIWRVDRTIYAVEVLMNNKGE